MQPTDHVISTETVLSPDPSAAPLVRALQLFYRAYQKASIYPEGHPEIPKALTDTAVALQDALTGRDTLLISVGREDLSFHGEKLSEGTDILVSLTRLLHDLDVAAIEFRPGVETSDFATFARMLSRARTEGLRGFALAEAMSEQRVVTIRLLPIDYDALRFSEGTRVPLAHEERQDVWDNLTRILLDPTSYHVELAPADLAHEVSREISSTEGTGLGVLRKKIERLTRQMNSLDALQRQQIRLRVSNFVTALTPGLRRELLRAGLVSEDEDSATLVSELGEMLPNRDLMAALRRVGSSERRVPDQFVTLLSKLMRNSYSHAEAKDDLKHTLENWGLSYDKVSEPDVDLRDVLEEVFQQRDDIECNPDTYQDLLDDLSHHQLRSGQMPLLERYRDPRDRDGVRRHSAEIAVRLLGLQDGPEHRATLLGYVGAATDSLLDHAQFGVVREATIVARAYGGEEGDDGALRKACASYLGDFEKTERINRILKRACDNSHVPKDAVRLLGLGGNEALHRVLDMLATCDSPGIEEVLRRFAVSRGPKALAKALEERIQRDWGALRPLLSVLQEAGEDAIPLLERLLDHDDVRVRREALLLLCDLDKRPGSPDRHLRRALDDESLSIVALAIQRLAERDGPGTIEILGSYIEGQLNGTFSLPAFGRRAAKHLIRRGPEGVTRLLACLKTLSWTLHPRKVELSAAVADLLRGHLEEEDVARQLRRWCCTPAGLMHRLIPAERRVTEGRQ